MINVVSCVYLTCDAAENCDPWEEGIPHFPTVDDALDWARSNEWLIVGDRIICRDHARQADCDVTGHQHGDWQAHELSGVGYRSRCCYHCGDIVYDPPLDVVSVLADVAEALDGPEAGRG